MFRRDFSEHLSTRRQQAHWAYEFFVSMCFSASDERLSESFLLSSWLQQLQLQCSDTCIFKSRQWTAVTFKRIIESCKRVSVNGRRCDRGPWKGHTKGKGLCQRERQGQIQLQPSLQRKKQETWTERTTRTVDRWPPVFLKWQTWAHCSRLQNAWCQRYSIDTSGTSRHILGSGAHPGTNVSAQPSRSSTSDLPSLTRYVNHCQSNPSMLSCFATTSESDARVFLSTADEVHLTGRNLVEKSSREVMVSFPVNVMEAWGHSLAQLWLSAVAFPRWKGSVDGWLFRSDMKLGRTSNLLLSHFCQVLRVGCRSAQVDNDVVYCSARLDVVDLKMAVILNVDERHDKTTPIFTSSCSPVLNLVLYRSASSFQPSRVHIFCWILFGWRVTTTACAVAVCCDSLCRSLNWERVTLLVRHCSTHFSVRGTGSLLNSACVRNCWLESAQTSFSSLLILSVRDRLRMPNSLRLHPCLLPCVSYAGRSNRVVHFVRCRSVVRCRLFIGPPFGQAALLWGSRFDERMLCHKESLLQCINYTCVTLLRPYPRSAQ